MSGSGGSGQGRVEVVNVGSGETGTYTDLAFTAVGTTLGGLTAVDHLVCSGMYYTGGD